MAEATGLAGGAVAFSVDLDASETPPSGLPQAGETMMTFTNNHLQYAITWYGLAAALLAVFAAYAARPPARNETRSRLDATLPAP